MEPKKVNFTPLPSFETSKTVNGVQLNSILRNKMQSGLFKLDPPFALSRPQIRKSWLKQCGPLP